MKDEIITFFVYQRQIFGVCPCCGELFRLSDCHIDKNPGRLPGDWMTKYKAESQKLDNFEMKIEEKRTEMKEKATAAGRAAATRQMKKADPLFNKLKLDVEDSKLILHPVDFLVFDGLNSLEETRRLVFVDEKASGDRLKLQKSIEKTIEKERYEWTTLQIDNAGQITPVEKKIRSKNKQ